MFKRHNTAKNNVFFRYRSNAGSALTDRPARLGWIGCHPLTPARERRPPAARVTDDECRLGFCGARLAQRGAPGAGARGGGEGGAGTRRHAIVCSPVVLATCEGPRHDWPRTCRRRAGAAGHSRQDRREQRTRRASSGAGRGQKAWVARAQGARGAGARRLRGMLGHACSRGSARRAAPGHGQQLCTINLERGARNLWAEASRAVGERRLGHEALSPAQGRALGARGASRLGSWAPCLSLLGARPRPPAFEYSVNCGGAWRFAGRRSS